MKVRNYLELEIDVPAGRRFSLHALTRGAYDAVYALQDDYSEAARDEYETELVLRELYLDARLGNLDLRLGRQQVVWGEAIGLRITDVVNPQDFREFILDDFVDSRIPLWMARFDLPLGSWLLEALWVPDLEPNKPAVPGSEWEFTMGGAAPSPDVLVVQDELRYPAQNLENSEWGLRASGYWKGWDLTGSYFHSWDDAPTYHSHFVPGGPEGALPTLVLSPEHHRLHTLGATFARPVGSFVFRGEMAYYLQKFFATLDPLDADGVAQKSYLYYMIGADYDLSGSLSLNGQFIQRYILGHDAFLAEDELQNIFSLYLRADLLRETLHATLLAAYSADSGGSWVNPELEYDYSDRISLTLGADILGGGPDDFFGQFDDNDRVFVELKYAF